jgi:S1-C subfamily serine protease
MQLFDTIKFLTQSILFGVLFGSLILFFMPNSPLSFNWQSAQAAWDFYQQQSSTSISESQQKVSLENVSFSNAVQKAYPSVVRIYAFRPKGIRDNNQAESDKKILDVGVGFGSGIILDDGYIVTNYHVIENAERISVNFYDGRSRFVNLVGFDKKTDIAILKTDIKDLNAAELANSRDVRTGDIVMAIGSPFGADQSVSLGIVSAVAHDPTAAKIQTDAAINNGNSGGPLINSQGDVIGINQMTISSRGGGQTGISAAIPIDIVKNIVSDIILHGRVRRNLLGIQAGALNLQGYRQYFPQIEFGIGIIVTDIEPGSPAESAGILVNDLITKIDDREVQGLSSFYQLFYDIPIGGKAIFEVVRGEQTIRLSVQLTEEFNKTLQ